MSIEFLIRKKGITPVLKSLKFKALNYNLIKKKINDQISARTLDYRLKDMVNLGLLEVKGTNNVGLSTKKYFITEKGSLILTLLEMGEDIIKDEILIENASEEFSTKYFHNLFLNFDRIWIQIKQIIAKQPVIYTLKQKKSNTIVEYDDTGFHVQTEKGTTKIGIEKIEKAWLNLVSDGYLERDDHRKATYRSSFLLSLFSQLSFVEINEGPPLLIKLKT